MKLGKSLMAWLRKSAGADPWSLVREFLRASSLSKSGETVTRSTAMQVSTVMACARLIADGIAQVPLKLFQESPDGLSRVPAKAHPLYRVLHRRPNDWQTSYEYREMLGLHLVLCGNAYSFKVLRRGQVVALWPFEPQHVTPVLQDDGQTLRYRVTLATGKVAEFPAEAIWHVRGPSWCGWLGLDAVKQAREAIGLAIATEAQHATLHANGVSVPGVYSVSGSLSPTQYEQLRQFIAENYTGAKRGLPMIVDRDAKFVPTAMTGVDSQHLETRRYQGQEICRSMRVIPLMVGLDDKGNTYASAEQMFLAHVVHTLSPWWERLEQSIDVNLLSEKDLEQGIYAKHVSAGLLRGSMKDRADYFAKALGSGGTPAWMTQDEVRGLDELNPMGGDAARLPVSTNVPKPASDKPDPAPQDEKADATLALVQEMKATLLALSTRQVPASEVHVKAGDVTVHMPEVKTDITVPEQRAAEQHHHITVPAAQVNVAAPEVRFNVQPAPVEVRAGDVVVNMPDQVDMRITAMPERRTSSEIERDAKNNIVKTVQTEKDA